VTPINESKRLDGVTYGGGMEFALTNHVSAKAEWMHYNLGAENVVLSTVGGTPVEFGDVSASGNTVRIGLNIHFGSRCCDAPLK
jgi:outer membrane immunogenic protein